MVARVRDGVTPGTAAAELSRISTDLVAPPAGLSAAGMEIVAVQET